MDNVSRETVIENEWAIKTNFVKIAKDKIRKSLVKSTYSLKELWNSICKFFPLRNHVDNMTLTIVNHVLRDRIIDVSS